MSFEHPVVTFREQFATRLRNHSVARQGAILTHKSANLASKIEETLARVGGLLTLVRIVRAREKGAQTIRTQYEAHYLVECTEKMALNKTGVDAWSLAFAIGDELKHATMADGPYKGFVTFDEDDIDEITPSSQPSLLSVGVPFVATIAGIPRPTTN